MLRWLNLWQISIVSCTVFSNAFMVLWLSLILKSKYAIMLTYEHNLYHQTIPRTSTSVAERGVEPLTARSAPANFCVATPTSGHAESPNWISLGLVKCLEISKELVCGCVTMPGCFCMPLLHNHLMDLCSYVHNNTLLTAKGGCICTPLTPPESATGMPGLNTPEHFV